MLVFVLVCTAAWVEHDLLHLLQTAGIELQLNPER
jgi:hypothetical protein